MAVRSTMFDIIKDLRHKVFDYLAEELDDDEHHPGDTAQFTIYFRDYAGTLTDPATSSAQIIDSDNNTRVAAGTLTQTATGTYVYYYTVPATAMQGDWKMVAEGDVGGYASINAELFKVRARHYIWTDEELQRVLDRNRKRIVREQMSHNATYLIYMSAFNNLEEAQIYDSSSDSATLISSSTYTANLDIGEFTFTSAQDLMSYYMDGISYDLYSSACELLRELRVDPSRAKQWSRGSVSHTGYDLTEIIKDYMRQSGEGISVGRVRRVYQS